MTAQIRADFAPGGALEMMGRYEAAQALGVAPSNLPAGMPEPLFRLKAGSFWLASEIRAFAEARSTR